jgi:anti-sigma factor RsiW
MTCRQLTDFIIDYRSGTLPPEARTELEAHLAECPDCVHYLKSYDETVRLARATAEGPDDPAPADVPEKLVQAILAARLKHG